MTANQITLIALLVIVACATVILYLKARRARKTRPPKTHGPHTPGPGYDPEAMAYSKKAGSFTEIH